MVERLSEVDKIYQAKSARAQEEREIDRDGRKTLTDREREGKYETVRDRQNHGEKR